MTPRITDGNVSEEDIHEKYQDNDNSDDLHDYITHIENDDCNSTDVSMSNKSNIEVNIEKPSVSLAENFETLTSSISSVKHPSDSECLQSRMKKKPKKQDDKYLEDLLKIESKSSYFRIGQ